MHGPKRRVEKRKRGVKGIRYDKQGRKNVEARGPRPQRASLHARQEYGDRARFPRSVVSVLQSTGKMQKKRIIDSKNNKCGGLLVAKTIKEAHATHENEI